MKRGWRKCRKCGNVKHKIAYSTKGRTHGTKGKPAKTTHTCRACVAAAERARDKQIERWKRYGRDCPRCGQRRQFPNEIGIANNAICLGCRLAARREIQKRYRDENPGMNIELCRRWRKKNPDLYKESSRRWREKWRKYLEDHPEVHREQLELRRISDKARRMEQGVKVKVRPATNTHSSSGLFLPSAPLMRFVAGYALRNPWLSELELGEHVGVSDKTLREWRQGKRPNVHEATADKILTKMGWLWWEVWEKPANGHEQGRPEDVLAYIDEAQGYIAACLAFEGELVE